MALKDLLMNLPEVQKPTEKKLGFNVKLKWTLAMLVGFFILANIPLFGVTQNALKQFEYLAIILGTDFGSVISLGISPIVMASIILQLLVGSKLLNIDLATSDGKRYFQGLQKLIIVFFCIFEATVYVMMKGLEASPGLEWFVILQLFLGGLLIVFMDEVVTKYGFGSGVSLFILAGVGWRFFASTFSPFDQAGKFTCFTDKAVIGKACALINSIIATNTTGLALALSAILATIAIFLLIVFAQAIKVEIPLSFGRIRGFGVRWPLKFFYTSVIPVILVSALLANLQIVAKLAENWYGSPTFLGSFTGATPSGGLIAWLYGTRIIDSIIAGSFKWSFLLHSLTYLAYMVGGCIIFAIFWVKTSNMDASSQARNILSSGLQIPGFRRDPRVLESILSRYIMPLAVMGGAAIGLVAALADLMGAIVGGTAILLAVMISFELYNEIANQHAYDMYPALKKIISK